MNLFDSGLHALALRVGQIGIEQRGLVGKTVPVVRDRAAVSRVRLERSYHRARRFPATRRIVGSDIGFQGLIVGPTTTPPSTVVQLEVVNIDNPLQAPTSLP